MPSRKSSKPWVDGFTIFEALEQTASAFPGNDALVFPQEHLRLSYADLVRQASAVAKSLLALGVRKGDHVAVWATNRSPWVLLQFATAQIGAVLVTVNPSYRTHELAYLLKQADISTLFLIDKFKTAHYFSMLKEICPALPRSRAFPKLRRVISLTNVVPKGILPWQEFLRAGAGMTDVSLRKARMKVKPGDVINIQYTSGTTGFPKGAMLTHRNLLMNAFYIGKAMRLTAKDRICIPVPFYHCFGCVLGVLCASVYGAAMVVPHEYFEALKTLEALHKEHCTVIYGVPTMFLAQLERPEFSRFRFPHLRTGIMAGAPCPIDLMRRVVKQMGAKQITIAYGQTETSPVITQTTVDDPLSLRVTTVGKSIEGVEVKIADPSGGKTLGTGIIGELCVRGHGVMKGYYNMPKETGRTIDKDGWLHTGDLALRTPRGYYKITGRIKDMILRGGENIYPREIEEFLYTHPKVAEVQVIGVPDIKYGEEICAWIRLKEGQQAKEKEIRDYCLRRIAHYKVPRYIAFVEEFPMTVTGKVQKYKMRQMEIRRLHLEKAAKVKTA